MTDQEKVLAEAKEIMDKFLSALNSSGVKEEDIGVDREIYSREPRDEELDEKFAKKMLSNANIVDDNCIIAEKKSW